MSISDSSVAKYSSALHTTTHKLRGKQVERERNRERKEEKNRTAEEVRSVTGRYGPAMTSRLPDVAMQSLDQIDISISGPFLSIPHSTPFSCACLCVFVCVFVLALVVCLFLVLLNNCEKKIRNTTSAKIKVSSPSVYES